MRKDLLLVQKELRPGLHSTRSWLVMAVAVLVLFTAGALYWRFHSRIALSSSDTLVLADMNNQTGDAALFDGMNLALQVAVQQTPCLNLLGDDKVQDTLRLLRLSEDTRITPDVALEVCRKTNSRAVISAFIGDAGNRFRIALSAIDCQSGKTLEQVVHEVETRDEIPGRTKPVGEPSNPPLRFVRCGSSANHGDVMDSYFSRLMGCLPSEAAFFVIATGTPAGSPQRFFTVADDTIHRAVTYSPLATGYSLLATGYLLLATGYSLLATGRSVRRGMLSL
jgi:hypothetical protein